MNCPSSTESWYVNHQLTLGLENRSPAWWWMVNPKRCAKKVHSFKALYSKTSKYQVFLGRFCGSNHLQRRCDWMFREGSPNCFRLIPPFGAFRYGARRSIRSFAQGFHQLGHALLHGRCTRRHGRGQDRGPWLWLTCLGNNLEHLRGAKMNGFRGAH